MTRRRPLLVLARGQIFASWPCLHVPCTRNDIHCTRDGFASWCQSDIQFLVHLPAWDIPFKKKIRNNVPRLINATSCSVLQSGKTWQFAGKKRKGEHPAYLDNANHFKRAAKPPGPYRCRLWNRCRMWLFMLFCESNSWAKRQEKPSTAFSLRQDLSCLEEACIYAYQCMNAK